MPGRRRAGHLHGRLPPAHRAKFGQRVQQHPRGLPAVNLPGGGGSIPCTGHNSGQCIGLAEEAEAAGPQAVPESTVGHSPTVTGGV